MKQSQQGPSPPDAERRQQERELTDLIARATTGDRSTLPQIQGMLRSPAGAEMAERLGNLAAVAERNLLAAFVGSDLMTGEAVRLKAEALRAELTGPEPTPLEKLLAERVVLCWLQLHIADARAARALDAASPQGDYYQRQQTQAQARYLAAVKALVTLRKLQRPTPSPLDLAARPVNETPPPKPSGRRLTPSAAGAPAENC